MQSLRFTEQKEMKQQLFIDKCGSFAQEASTYQEKTKYYIYCYDKIEGMGTG